MKLTEKKMKCDIFTAQLYNFQKSKNAFQRFFAKRKIKKFKKAILNGSPDFDTLWDMALFIKNAEKIFFYDNDIDKVDNELGLYSSKNFPLKQNGFKITTDSCRVILKLFIEGPDSKRLALEIDTSDPKYGKINLTFVNSKWNKEPTMYDEMILEQVIRLINNQIINLFDYCFNKLK